ncbi:MAG: GNAT family N-acetyltransferase [Candidatus Poribacteria bacterium]|nr:GNAT family N-acetyltransferase [Candidatus Poribacteria bacterium]
MLILVDRSGEQERLVAYLLYSGVFPNAKVQQIATVETYRQQGMASILIRHLVNELEKFGYMTIRADVASDLDSALAFYAKNGFERVRTQAGGASKKRQIVLHVRNLETETLFTRLTDTEQGIDLGIRRRSAGDRPFFVLDLNVYLDLAKNRSNSDDARRLFGAAMAHEIRLVVADEFVKELRRSSNEETNDPILQLALRLPRLPKADFSQQQTLTKQIHDFIFVQSGASKAESPQAISDAGHLAHATLARASAFVTRDGRILDARSVLLKRFGIDVVTVEEVLSILPSDQVQNSTMPHLGRGFVCDVANCETVRSYMSSQFLSSQIISEFATEDGHSVDCIRRVIHQDGDTFACAVLLAPRNPKPICRMIVHIRPEVLDVELYTDHLLDALLREASATAATTVELECVAGQSALIRIARARGFLRQQSTSSLAKIVMGRPITATNWISAIRELRIRTDLQLPSKMPEEDQAEAFPISTIQNQSINISLKDLEDLLGPTLLIRPDRNGVIVPITKDYSKLLLDADPQMSFGLTDDKDAAFFSRKAYVNTPRAANAMRPESPILFYESMSSNGVGAIVAVGRIVDAVILNKQDIPDDALRRLVVEDVHGFSTSEDVLVTSFDNLFVFPNSVSIRELRKMGAVDGANLVTAKKVTGQSVTEILDRGWRNG